jgi:hypothetical protein
MRPRPTFYRFVLPRAAALLAAGSSAGLLADTATDKSGFTLFNPTPRALMREMSTDRPDTTESPYTVDAGHAQIELSFIDSTLDRRSPDGTSTSTLAVLPLLVKVGLTNSIDLQLGLDPFTRQIATPAGGADETIEGFGDTMIRLKINLFGNDDDGPALALMPFIKLPTADDGLGNDEVEGGLIIPFAMGLPAGFGLGAMIEFDALRTDDDGVTVDLVHTVTLSHQVVGNLGAFIEYAGFADLRHTRPYRAYLDAGLGLAITEDLILDGGARIGLNRAADDLGLFLGLSVRF